MEPVSMHRAMVVLTILSSKSKKTLMQYIKNLSRSKRDGVMNPVVRSGPPLCAALFALGEQVNVTRVVAVTRDLERQ